MDDSGFFFSGVCRGLGWEPTPWRLAVFEEWHIHEGMPWWTWNPLATTRLSEATPLNLTVDFGYGKGNWNSVPVRCYASMEAGIQATIETLALPFYLNVRRCFADETGYDEAVPELAVYVGSVAYGQALVNFMKETQVADPRVDDIVHKLAASGIDTWVANGNEPIILTIGKIQADIATIQQTLQSIHSAIAALPAAPTILPGLSADGRFDTGQRGGWGL